MAPQPHLLGRDAEDVQSDSHYHLLSCHSGGTSKLDWTKMAGDPVGVGAVPLHNRELGQRPSCPPPNHRLRGPQARGVSQRLKAGGAEPWNYHRALDHLLLSCPAYCYFNLWMSVTQRETCINMCKESCK